MDLKCHGIRGWMRVSTCNSITKIILELVEHIPRALQHAMTMGIALCMSVHNNAVKVKTKMKMNTKMEIKLKIKIKMKSNENNDWPDYYISSPAMLYVSTQMYIHQLLLRRPLIPVLNSSMRTWNSLIMSTCD